MSDAIIVAIIGAIFTFAGVVLTTWASLRKANREATAQREKAAADSKAQTDLILYRIDELEKKQDKHNEVIERTFRLEERIELHEEKIKVANHRIDDLERKNA